MEIPWRLPTDHDAFWRPESPTGTAGRYFYRGTSMTPILQFADVLHLEPFGRKTLRCGDVVVYQRQQDAGPIVHRVVAVDQNSLRTKGDNNPAEDPYIVHFESLLGVVRFAQRGKRIVRVSGGLVGCLVAAMMRMRRSFLLTAFRVLRVPYHRLSHWGLLKALFSRALRFKVVGFTRGEHRELQLFVSGIPAGVLKPHRTTWEIRPPFRLVVDESSLPKNNGAIVPHIEFCGKDHPPLPPSVERGETPQAARGECPSTRGRIKGRHLIYTDCQK
jgi:signal peptidase I